jgi:hypothetical protein
MLHSVSDHADQPDRRCHWRVPAGIDDPVQLLCSNPIQIAQGELMNCAVIVGEEVTASSNGRYISWTLSITGSPLAKGQAEPLPPLCPNLLDLREVGDMIVLDPGEVPQQPGNRVRLRIGPVAGHLVGQVIGEINHKLSYPAKCIDQYLLRMLGHVCERYMRGEPFDRLRTARVEAQDAPSTMALSSDLNRYPPQPWFGYRRVA